MRKVRPRQKRHAAPLRVKRALKSNNLSRWYIYETSNYLTIVYSWPQSSVAWLYRRLMNTPIARVAGTDCRQVSERSLRPQVQMSTVTVLTMPRLTQRFIWTAFARTNVRKYQTVRILRYAFIKFFPILILTSNTAFFYHICHRNILMSKQLQEAQIVESTQKLYILKTVIEIEHFV